MCKVLALFNKYLEESKIQKAPQGLYEPINYVLSMGGKRIRPVLMLMAYSMYRNDAETILPAALAIETYHNFTLLHDDVMDNADTRRGMPTVHKKWNENTAILSGDTMLLLAFQRMMQVENKRLKEALDLFVNTMLEIDEGQQYDIDFETREDVTEDEYIEMIRLKTSVLLACALKIGAILADAPQEDCDKLYDFGVNMGLAFQLQDDYLDVYGDFKTFGKAIGGDILCDKKTFMRINAALRAKDFDFNRQYASPEEKIADVTRLYSECGIDKLALEKIEYYYDLARKSLDCINLPQTAKQPLYDYLNGMLKRDK
ncbi:MAG: polyprenyl synthetase family protein [Bacteroidaceae bacterium]|nr:polyprenyl synthetase family protein [Bacteroidaceae bacterium]